MINNTFYFTLSNKEKIQACRMNLFLKNKFFGSICIQFKLKEKNNINNIIFDQNFLYYSPNIYRYASQKLIKLMLKKIILYTFQLDLTKELHGTITNLFIEYSYPTVRLFQLYKDNLIFNPQIYDKIKFALYILSLEYEDVKIYLTELLNLNNINITNNELNSIINKAQTIDKNVFIFNFDYFLSLPCDLLILTFYIIIANNGIEFFNNSKNYSCYQKLFRQKIDNILYIKYN